MLCLLLSIRMQCLRAICERFDIHSDRLNESNVIWFCGGTKNIHIACGWMGRGYIAQHSREQREFRIPKITANELGLLLPHILFIF